MASTPPAAGASRPATIRHCGWTPSLTTWPFCVCVDELRARLPAILERTGYAELTRGLGPDLRQALDEVDARLRGLGE